MYCFNAPFQESVVVDVVVGYGEEGVGGRE